MTPADVPVSESDVTAAWLSAALGVSCRSVERERIGEGFGLSSVIYRVRLTGASGPASVVVKLWDTTGPAGVREVQFFRSFGENVGLRTPACHHGAIDERAERGVLVLEDLGRVEQGDCLVQLPRGRSLAVADMLAALHARWWRSPALDEADWLPLPPRMQREPEWIADRRARILLRFGPRFDGFSRRLLDDAEAAHDRGMDLLAEAPHTFLHADLHLDNFVFDADTAQPILLDWARCARGPAVVDLGDLVFGPVEEEDTDEFLAAYLQGLHARGVTELDLASLTRQLGGALLLVFVTWTCGLARWLPDGDRERRMVDAGLQRAMRGVARWRERDPGLFRP